MLNVTDLGEGLPIVWIHGFPLASSIFEHQLAIRGVRHIMPDLPGFGQSRPDGAELTIESYARMIVHILDERGLDGAVIAGLSMGGYIALALARIAPERIRALILLDTRETADSPLTRRGRYESVDKARKEGVAPIVESMLPKMLTAKAPQEMRDRVREIMTSSSQEGVIAALRAMAERPEAGRVLSHLTMPVLIVVGEEDAITPPADAERMAKTLPGARLVRIPGAAHLANYEKAEEVNRAVGAFVSKLETPA